MHVIKERSRRDLKCQDYSNSRERQVTSKANAEGKHMKEYSPKNCMHGLKGQQLENSIMHGLIPLTSSRVSVPISPISQVRHLPQLNKDN
jgi:hypothetical protein